MMWWSDFRRVRITSSLPLPPFVIPMSGSRSGANALSGALPDDDHLVRFALTESLAVAARPADLDALIGRVAAQAEVKARIALRQVSRSPLDLSRQGPPTNLHCHPCAERVDARC